MVDGSDQHRPFAKLENMKDEEVGQPQQKMKVVASGQQGSQATTAATAAASSPDKVSANSGAGAAGSTATAGLSDEAASTEAEA